MPGGGGIDMGPGGYGCGQTLLPESYNYSLYLDGSTDYIRGGMTTTMFQDFTSHQDWSLKFTFKLDTIGAIQTLAVVGPTDESDFVKIYVTTDGKLWLTSGTSSATRLTRGWVTGIAADTWYEVIITCDASADNRALLCYLNGVAKDVHTVVISVSSTSLLPATGKVGWGRSLDTSTDYDFKIDSIASWDSVLTAVEASAIHGDSANPYSPQLTQNQKGYVSAQHLTSYYKIEEGTGTNLADSSGHSGTTDLTNVGTSTWSDDTRFNPE